MIRDIRGVDDPSAYYRWAGRFYFVAMISLGVTISLSTFSRPQPSLGAFLAMIMALVAGSICVGRAAENKRDC